MDLVILHFFLLNSKELEQNQLTDEKWGMNKLMHEKETKEVAYNDWPLGNMSEQWWR